MQINTLTPDYSVSGQIAPSDLDAIREAGFRMVICNRPDDEVTTAEGSGAIGAAAAAAGLPFAYVPFSNGALDDSIVANHANALAAADGPVFAYCRSGMRSSVLWALARAGEIPVDDLIAAAARGGYALEPLRPQIEAAARG